MKFKTVKEYKPGTWFIAHSVQEMQAFYMSRLAAIRAAAKECGYAIGLHGSTRRDLDLIAMPWREKVLSPDRLAKEIMRAACGISSASFDWEKKPSGRIACSIPICWAQWEGCYNTKSLGHIDLCLIPAIQEKEIAEGCQRCDGTGKWGWSEAPDLYDCEDCDASKGK